MELIGFERFEELVGEALDLLSDELFDAMDNVAFVVCDGDEPGLLGLYDGIPLTERGIDYGAGAVMPDRISIFRNTICAVCATDREVIEQVRITVLHEIAHHFGIDDDRLDELGWA
ncbi:MAG: metallopeptidase family protein [Actinomycetia bacterium]|nr:metallopeptidase family protein [Actinomycetes bacterium]MCP4960573.1 metallopeptidase family protein [Actinomycetes bacterium]